MNNITALLFYSPNCQHCVKCLGKLEPYATQIPFLGYVNIHETKDKLPECVTRVPCLVLNNGNIVYQGKHVFDWIDKYISISGYEKQQQSNSTTNKESNSKSFESLQSASSNKFISLNEMKTTISDNIDYTKVKNIDPEPTKTNFNMEMIVEKRNNDLNSFKN
jgi:hypothetical protein